MFIKRVIKSFLSSQLINIFLVYLITNNGTMEFVFYQLCRKKINNVKKSMLGVTTKFYYSQHLEKDHVYSQQFKLLSIYFYSMNFENLINVTLVMNTMFKNVLSLNLQERHTDKTLPLFVKSERLVKYKCLSPQMQISLFIVVYTKYKNLIICPSK